jgi:hypothetical protein
MKIYIPVRRILGKVCRGRPEPGWAGLNDSREPVEMGVVIFGFGLRLAIIQRWMKRQKFTTTNHVLTFKAAFIKNIKTRFTIFYLNKCNFQEFLKTIKQNGYYVIYLLVHNTTLTNI